jgi:hypothetical protein
MSECPEPASKGDCGLVAMQDLIDRELIVIDTVAKGIGETGVYIDQKGETNARMLTVKRLFYEGMTDMLDVGCVACGKCLRLTDDLGDMAVRIMET